MRTAEEDAPEGAGAGEGDDFATVRAEAEWRPARADGAGAIWITLTRNPPTHPVEPEGVRTWCQSHLVWRIRTRVPAGRVPSLLPCVDGSARRGADFWTTPCRPLEPENELECPLDEEPGMVSFWPGWRVEFSEMPFALAMARVETPYLRESSQRVSPVRTVCVAASAAEEISNATTAASDPRTALLVRLKTSAPSWLFFGIRVVCRKDKVPPAGRPGPAEIRAEPGFGKLPGLYKPGAAAVNPWRATETSFLSGKSGVLWRASTP